MPVDMKKIDVYLKRLAEKRARAAGDVKRYQEATDQASTLLAKAKAVLEACDVLIREHDDRLDPAAIEAIRTWQNHPKKRGDLKAALLEVVTAHSPEGLTTDEVCDAIEARWQLKFLIPGDRVEWKRGSIGRQLRRLAKRGIIEPMHDQTEAATVEAGRWRLKTDPVVSLDHLRVQIEAQGGEVRVSDVAHA
jgi:hypothetical protein